MRKLFYLLVVLVAAIILAGSPLTVHAMPAAAPVTGHGLSLTMAASPQSGVSLLCVLPQCDGPYCRGSNGCLVCCHG